MSFLTFIIHLSSLCFLLVCCCCLPHHHHWNWNCHCWICPPRKSEYSSNFYFITINLFSRTIWLLIISVFLQLPDAADKTIEFLIAKYNNTKDDRDAVDNMQKGVSKPKSITFRKVQKACLSEQGLWSCSCEWCVSPQPCLLMPSVDVKLTSCFLLCRHVAKLQFRPCGVLALYIFEWFLVQWIHSAGSYALFRWSLLLKGNVLMDSLYVKWCVYLFLWCNLI